ncbi:type IV pilus biogenesis protein PilM [Desulfovibrio sp. JC010]|uniref:type IV pilus biogenesis protein PilM n=1 Tax=Desulfovibrio sp. JC010 TaxID=2593641 RepID=UPI0013D11C87|nr:type IV pilus biogenesis protein PilM [Desulfovibrio sp. JC010]NDV26912.1 pilus assembly protein PilM [Desulfovibrio sp. JC010]
MKMFAVLFTMLGLLAMLTPDSFLQHEVKQGKAKAVAVNFGTYRNAVNDFAIARPNAFGGIPIPISLLDLPSGWKSMRAWTNRPDGGNIYVWGPVQGAEAGEIMDLFMESYAIGIKRSGSLVTAHGTGIALPSFIPNGNIVSVIRP